MGITTSTAAAIAQARVDSVLHLIPTQYRDEARNVTAEWVTAAGTDGEESAAQALVDAGYSLGQETRQWGTVDSVLSALLSETPDAERWVTTHGYRFSAAGRVYGTTSPASETARIDTAAPTTAPVSGDVMERIASAVERIATALESADL